MNPPRPYGLWSEWRLREEYERGGITVEVFEREMERILRYEATCTAPAAPSSRG